MKQELYEKLVTHIVENQNQFYRIAFSYAGNKEDALDIVQNAICKALENYEMIRNEKAIRTWFYRILVNESMLLLKQHKKEMSCGEQEWLLEVPYFEKAYEAEGDAFDQINQLEEDVQSIIKLRFFEELSLKEIAEIMDLNLNTVKAKLYRGLKTLKQRVKEGA